MEQSWTDFLAKRRQALSNTGRFRDGLSPAKRVLQRNIHLIRAKDTTGRMACYYVLVPETRRTLFLEALRSPETISLNDYGEVVASNYGEKPNEQTKRILREKYGLEV